MRLSFQLFTLCAAALVVLGMRSPKSKTIGVAATLNYVQREARALSQQMEALHSALERISSNDSLALVKSKSALIDCRKQYKRIEFFMHYFLPTAAIIYNAPAKPELEEPYMEYEEPVGFQVMESLLFEDDILSKKAALLTQADILKSSAADIGALLYAFNGTDAQVLESLQLQLVRIMTLSISGFDAALLKSGVEEAEESMKGIDAILSAYLLANPDSNLKELLKKASQLLHNQNFDSFDRLQFLTEAAVPLQQELYCYINGLGLQLNTTDFLSYNAKGLFNKNAICIDASINADPMKIALGKQLFFETALSGDRKRSCASCHKPSLGFSDGLSKNLSFSGKKLLKRNTPGLLYAGFQHTQFWEGRANNLQEQIGSVLINLDEMHGDTTSIIKLLEKDSRYTILFRNVYGANDHYKINTALITDAIASFICSLAPMNSRFDRFMAGDRQAMNREEQKGFNLFMGKAQCGTCHFAPLFNGLVPPFFNKTEVEVLGVPETDNLEKPSPDEDQGRYALFPVPFYKQAFKTPTVRNTALTAPYMHNGAFTTLQKVVEFYNKGGGAGIGLETKSQSLSAKPLNLSVEEQNQIVSFLKALTDSIAL